MIPTDRLDVLSASLATLDDFSKQTGARGRFISLYLGLRRMGADLAALGSAETTSSSEIEAFMDSLLTKTHRPEPFVVLTAPFGGSTSPTAPYSTRSGEKAPGNSYPTNTWRNNFGIQKGIGCPADAETISALLDEPTVRLACPHMVVDTEGAFTCSIDSTNYRGEEHSIWLRKTSNAWQSTDLDNPRTYEPYLTPGGKRIPIFSLIGALYVDAPEDAYPARGTVGLPEFSEDFSFSLDQVEELFDCNPTSFMNAAVLRAADLSRVVSRPLVTSPEASSEKSEGGAQPAAPLPDLVDPGMRNSGLQAELDVADDLASHGWGVAYRGSQTGVGYDLEAKDSQGFVLRVEVKSSFGFTHPELTESEWAAAQEHGEEYVLAIVDFVGSPKQAIWYVRDPATNLVASEKQTTSYRLKRIDLVELRVDDADFL